MKIVTYNIQYGIGLDGRFDLKRIADAVRGADIIALQEVTRNNPQNGGRDLVSGIRELLPDYFAFFGAPYAADMGSRIEDGRAVETWFEFGNMILSRTPIQATRSLLLPRRRSYGKLNLQRGALEALIDTPFGPVRFYSVHLDHTRPDERMDQIRFLLGRALGYPLEGGAVSGVDEIGFPEPPHPEAFILLGDFNMIPGSPEYLAMTGMPDDEHGMPWRATNPVDAARHAGSAGGETFTWIDPRHPEDASRRRRIDYGFVSAGMAGRIVSVRVDHGAKGSDHLPVWFELE
ncbi:endonuclease/exonuclease/phosphatase family metal-dependent hydrolase [Mesorhizobium sp. J18]|uniref:endonuclease/exonuclease/phosphatase family protein n=1 Tax=Mesorhizobium sp. J18 TaxID=935263 RepID=UPI0011990101|nr:endonuclease/exonuclease/phosphatase family protein [Mesorhizobium sp. J18]TWG98981.1 endonuclease/exonuclease/phosphatase family metal-dependent hydrolase [Mesorhizobium sp. J18]